MKSWRLVAVTLAMLIVGLRAFVSAQDVKEAVGESSAHGAGEIIDVRPLLFRQVTEAL